MFKKFYEEWKKNNIEIFGKSIEELETQYDKFWSILMEDLQKKKVAVEEELKTRQKEVEEMAREADDLSVKMLTIAEGTVITAAGEKPERLVVENVPAADVPPIPDYLVSVSSPYALVVYVGNNRVQHAKFSENFLLTINYNEADVPPGAFIFIAFYDEELRQWVQLDPAWDIIQPVGTISSYVNHFTVFTVMAEKTKVVPASISLESVSAGAQAINLGDSITVTAALANTGGLAGEYTLLFRMTGMADITRTLSIKPGETRNVEFTLIPDQPGTYKININGLTDSFVVAAPQPLIHGVTITPNIFLFPAILILIIIYLIIRFTHPRRRYAEQHDFHDKPE